MPQEAAGAERHATGAEQRSAAGTEVEPHKLQAVLAVVAVTIGIAALIMGWIPQTHLPGAVAGVIGLPIALYSQLISATTNERWLNVIGMVTSFLGVAFALSHGGFSV
ncbi:hypothetical protein [Actinomadura chibensis]|uniref:FUSC family protein n=1 Tax=Actinomadura chibensis TaxID=392828 RepID=A0A5D0NYM8_9ACTN|nr:hypothetical protein [Actinomadura chibensis]TYB49268.1 hypothetical protein FXF69_09195 [Actinomadura chibensis]